MLKNFLASIKNNYNSDKSVPWVLLVACILGYGLLIPFLGYYQDDWSVVFNHYLFGNKGIIDLMAYDGRPFSPWLYLLGFNLIGYKPVLWQIAALLVRWLATVCFWRIFLEVWPDSKWQNLTAALLFALYPFFTLQPLATTFILHWTSYLLYGLSILFMLRSLKERYWLYTFLAVFGQILHLFTLEFFAGIELLRPIFLWLALNSLNHLGWREKLKTIRKRWLPYIIVLLAFFIWRGFIYKAIDVNRNAPVGVTGLLSNPIGTLFSVALIAIPDLVLILISSWYKLLDPGALNFSISINRYVFLLSIVSFLLFYFFFSRQKLSKEEGDSSATQMILVGGFALVLGLVPVYAAGYEIYTKLAPWNSRFSLGSLFGAALVITGLIDLVVKGPKTRWVTIAVILGLLVGWQFRNANDFRWGWDKQLNFYRQLSLRAPAIEPGTALLSEEEFLMFMGNYSTSYGINLIYSKEQGNHSASRQADYWLFTFAEISPKLDEYLSGTPFSTWKGGDVPRAGITFDSQPKGSVVISFVPESGQCLWVMRPEYASAKILSETTRQLLPFSYVDRIQQAPLREDSFLFKYLYPHPKQDWCYFYEKADLASQYQEWDQVIQLWKTAEQNGLQPENGFEYLPFLESFGRTGDWTTAKKLTRISEKTMQGIEPLLCEVWSRLETETPDSAEKTAAISSVRDDLGCDQE